MALLSCEEFDALDDLGARGDVLGNVYLDVFGQQVPSGSTREVEVQYWSVDDFFTYTGLWDSVGVTDEFKVTIDKKEYKVETEGTAQFWEQETEYPFDFANWNPSLKAYRVDVSYTVDVAYAKKIQSDKTISANSFWQSVPEGFEAGVYTYFTNNLSRAKLNEILVDTYTEATQELFDTYYGEEGNLTTAGREAIRTGLETIGAVNLIGNGFTITTDYQITAAFRVINGSGIANEDSRTFSIQ